MKLLITFLAGLAFAEPVAAQPKAVEGDIVWVRDADTIELDTINGIAVVLLFGLAVPSLFEPGGKEARVWVLANYLGVRVRCFPNGEWSQGRTVAQCYDAKGRDLSERVVNAGHGYLVPIPVE